MEKTKFERYNEYFDKVSKACNEENLQGTLKMEDSVNLNGYEHYLLDNGLHVYKKDDGVVITKEDITGYATIPGKDFYSADIVEDVSMYRSEDGCRCGMNIAGGMIEYKAKECFCDLPTQIEKVDTESKKGYYYEETDTSDKYRKNFKGDLPSIDYILNQMTDMSKDDETLEVYNQAKELEESIYALVRESKITLENAVRNAIAKGININDLTDEELVAKYMEEQVEEDKGVSVGDE